MKKYRWSLTTLICSWAELLGYIVMIWAIGSYIEIIFKNLHSVPVSNWNMLKVMINLKF